MARNRRLSAGGKGSDLGVSPTNSQKLIYISNKLKLTGIQDMQGSSFNIFDTIAMATNTGANVLSFFSNSNSKSLNFTNLPTGKLQAGEAMIIERMTFFCVLLSSATLTVDSASITDVIPISSLNVASGQFTQPGSIKTAQANISIANQTVSKTYNIFESVPEFNPQTCGTAVGVQVTATPSTVTGTAGYNGIAVEAPPVLPPNQAVTISLRMGPVGTMTGIIGMQCVLGRFGSIFASKTTL